MKPWFLIEREWIPDPAIRWGIRRLLAKRIALEASRADQLPRLVEDLKKSPIAIHTDEANRQHYELPTEFFQTVLGPRLKYSCCWWEKPSTTLAEAEHAMLALTCERAQLADGLRILELGCGWGSLSLFMAERYPAARIVAVSNSRTQKAFIDGQAREKGLKNLDVITADMNDFATSETFDRVVSVEMFEHMRNYEQLLARIRRWLVPHGLLFVHIFCHRRYAYLFEADGDDDWMAKYFFTGGVMPSFDLLSRFDRDMRQVQSWEVNGIHYSRTLEAWLEQMDRSRAKLWPIFENTYGADQAQRWWVYWRIFFMACSELFAYRGGTEWFVGHYLFAPRT